MFAQLEALEQGEAAAQQRQQAGRNRRAPEAEPSNRGLPWEEWSATVRGGGDDEARSDTAPGFNVINRLAAMIFEGLAAGGREPVTGPGPLALLMLGQEGDGSRSSIPWRGAHTVGRLPAHLVFRLGAVCVLEQRVACMRLTRAAEWSATV